jgi:hypothetical protein
VKLLVFIHEEFFAQMPKESAPDIARLQIFIETFQKNGTITPPKASLLQ